MMVESIHWKRVEDHRALSLAEHGVLRVQAGGRPICLVRHEGRLHALLDRCPHQGSSFAGGWCEDGYLVCPRHRMGFALLTGRARAGGTDAAEVFPVEERTDGVYIGFACITIKLFGVELW